MNQPTPEKRREAAEKRRLTYQRKRQREIDKRTEHENTVRILKEIRDSSDAAPGERLRAIELLKDMGA